MRAWRAWDRFWFAPIDPLPLALVRIALGVLITLWALSLGPQLPHFFTADGIMGEAARGRPWYAWTLLGGAPSPWLLGAVFAALLTAAPALALGWHTRVASIVVFLAVHSLQRTDPWVFNSGDVLLRLLCLYVMLAPAGAALSLDARRRGPHEVPAWSLRLLQLQVSAMYLGAVWAKLRGPSWRDGSATAYALRLPELQRFPGASLLDHSVLLADVLTYGTLAIEAALAVLVWPHRTRRFVLLAGCALHIGIDLTLRVGFFTPAVLTAYLAFTNPAWVRSKLRKATNRNVPALTTA
jgi:hypothetical protein